MNTPLMIRETPAWNYRGYLRRETGLSVCELHREKTTGPVNFTQRIFHTR